MYIVVGSKDFSTHQPPAHISITMFQPLTIRILKKEKNTVKDHIGSVGKVCLSFKSVELIGLYPSISTMLLTYTKYTDHDVKGLPDYQ